MGQCASLCGGDEHQPAPGAAQRPQKRPAEGGYPVVAGGGGGQRNNQAQPPAQQQQQPRQTAPPQSAPAFRGPRDFPASSTAGDPHRAQAGVHAKRRGELMAQSQAAWQSGDKALAKKLSDQGKAEGEAMERCNAAAAQAYFDGNNRERGLGVDQIDLHGLHVEEAISRVEARIRQCESQRVPQLIVIVGKGNHSKDGVRKIEPAIQKLIREHRLRVVVDSPNEGCVTILFGQGQGDSGMVHAPNSQGDAGCVLM